MRPLLPFPTVSPEAIDRLREDLLEEGHPNTNFVVLIISSCLIASFGLLGNSTAVIIGAMIIAPLMMPLRALSFGALEGDVTLFRRSGVSLIIGTSLGISLSWGLGILVDLPEFGSEVLARTQPNLIDLGIAIVAGAIAAYAKVRPKISDALAGTAIAVALMPPLCVVGLTLSQGDWQACRGAFLLYLTNLLGISLACMLVFILAGYIPQERPQTKGILRLVLGLTAVLVVPLALSFSQLLQEARLKAGIKNILIQETVTVGQQVRLQSFEVNSRHKPAQIYLTVETDTPPTPLQVRLVEDFLFQRLGRSFNLVFRVNQVDIIQSYPGPLYQTYPSQAPQPSSSASPLPLDSSRFPQPPRDAALTATPVPRTVPSRSRVRDPQMGTSRPTTSAQDFLELPDDPSIVPGANLVSRPRELPTTAPTISPSTAIDRSPSTNPTLPSTIVPNFQNGLSPNLFPSNPPSRFPRPRTSPTATVAPSPMDMVSPSPTASTSASPSPATSPTPDPATDDEG